jgi:hypothetical protein
MNQQSNTDTGASDYGKMTWEDIQRIDEAIKLVNRSYGLAVEAYEAIEDGVRVEQNLEKVIKKLKDARFLLLRFALDHEGIEALKPPTEPALANMIRDIFSAAYAPYGVAPERTRKLMGGSDENVGTNG